MTMIFNFKSVKTLSLGVAILAVPLSACANNGVGVAQTSFTESMAFLRVNIIHEARFAPNSPRLNQKQDDALNAFLTRTKVRVGENVQIEAPFDPNDHIAKLRQDLLHKYFQAKGLHTSSVALPGTKAHRIRIISEREIAQMDNCMKWAAPERSDTNNAPSRNLGCATATNLIAMIADPQDLFHGRTPVASQSARHFNVIAAKKKSGSIINKSLGSKDFSVGSN
jgi:pilus assembly protein CpaD